MNPLDRYKQIIRITIRPLPSPPPALARPIDQLLLRYAPLLTPAPPDHDNAVQHWSQVTPPAVPDDFPARLGAQLSLTCWTALALSRTGQPQPAAQIFSRLADRQQPAGALLQTTASDNPETTWYHELILLHALTSFAAHAPNRDALLPAIHRAALYHLHETQPDHATTQPWALNAFLLSPDTYPLADQLLHTLQTQHPAGPDPVSSILLTDTLLSLP